MTYTFGRIGSLLGAPAAINGVISEIETAVNSLVSKTDNTGNQMSVSLDLNSNRILNLPPPLYDHEPARFSDLLSVQTGALTLLGPQASIRGGIFLSSPIATKFVSGVNSNGDLIYTRPTMTDISGLLPYATGAAGTGLNATASGFSSSNQALWLVGNLTGVGTGPYSIISVNDTSSNSTAGTAQAALWVAHNIKAGAGAGNRSSLLPILVKDAALPGTDKNLKFYVPFFSQFYINAGDGGSAGNYMGDHYGGASIVQAQTGATWLETIQGYEVDVSVQTGANVRLKSGILIAGVNNDSQHADEWEAFLAFTRDGTSSATWNRAIDLFYPQGQWAFNSTTTILGSSYAGAIGWGIDFSNLTITNYAFKSPNFNVSGAGAINASTIISSGSVAGLVTGPRSGSGNSYQWYNPTGVSLVLTNGASDLITLADSGDITTIGSIKGTVLATSSPTTITNNYTVGSGDSDITCNGSASITLTLPSASANPGRIIWLRNIAAFTVVSASSNVIPLAGGAAGTAIMAATAGKWVRLKSDGSSNWIITAGN